MSTAPRNKPMLRNGDTKRICRLCETLKKVSLFPKGGRSKVCKECEAKRKQRGKLRSCLKTLRVVEVIGDDRFHVANVDAQHTVCVRENVFPVKYGNGPAMLLALCSDKACCAKCRAKLEKVFEAVGE